MSPAIPSRLTWLTLLSRQPWYVLWPPWVWGVLVLAAAGYLMAAVGPWRVHFDGHARARPAQVGWFLAALATLGLAFGTPLWFLGQEAAFSAHMVELSLETMVAVPMLLVGMPDFLLRPLWNCGPTRYVLRATTHPLMALGMFTVVFSLWQLPVFFDPSLRNPYLHAVELVVLGLLALVWWWPIWSTLPERPRLKGGALMIYVVAAVVFLFPLLFFLVMGGVPGYPVYGQAERIFGLTPATDMQMGGVLFRAIDIVSLGVAGVNAFMHWGDPVRFPDPVPPADTKPRDGHAAPAARRPTTTPTRGSDWPR